MFSELLPRQKSRNPNVNIDTIVLKFEKVFQIRLEELWSNLYDILQKNLFQVRDQCLQQRENAF